MLGYFDIELGGNWELKDIHAVAHINVRRRLRGEVNVFREHCTAGGLKVLRIAKNLTQVFGVPCCWFISHLYRYIYTRCTHMKPGTTSDGGWSNEWKLPNRPKCH